MMLNIAQVRTAVDPEFPKAGCFWRFEIRHHWFRPILGNHWGATWNWRFHPVFFDRAAHGRRWKGSCPIE
ncbi:MULTISPECIES: hypothetical protein [Mesorhizobium]|uniref:hypothetical protein n=1 Tax=Mesorhizobium TaxID=68287 RepID=UPI00333D6B0F